MKKALGAKVAIKTDNAVEYLRKREREREGRVDAADDAVNANDAINRIVNAFRCVVDAPDATKLVASKLDDLELLEKEREERKRFEVERPVGRFLYIISSMLR